MSYVTTTTMNEEVGISNSSALFNGTDSNPDFNETDTDALIYVRSPGYAYWICNVVSVVLGLTGNALLMVLMEDVKFSTLSYPVYLKFLAIADSLVLLQFGIRESLRLFTSPFVVGSNSILCAVTKYAITATTMSSPWLVVGLTVDRFFCVVFPLKRHLLCTRKIAIITCTSICVLSGTLCLPLLSGSRLLTDGNACYIKDNLLAYFTFLRLLVNSNMPCLLILIFNIVIGIHIQRSARFRKKFTNVTSGSTKDNSLRPLLLVSMLAFLTIMPSSVVESVVSILMERKIHLGTVNILLKWYLVFNVPYLINFAQNFYILMASSANYRNIMKNKLKSLTDSRRTESVMGSPCVLHGLNMQFRPETL